MLINSGMTNKVDTLDRTNIVSYDIYKSYRSGDISIDTLASLLHDMINDRYFNNSAYVHNNICKIVLDLASNDLITDADVAKYLDTSNQFAGEFLIINMITINKYFKFIPMCKLADIIKLTKAIENRDIRESILRCLVYRYEDVENLLYYIILFNKLNINSNRKIDKDQYNYYINIFKFVKCIIKEDINKSKFSSEMLYEENKAFSLFIDKAMYDITKIAYDNMFEEDKEIVKNIYYNLEERINKL